VVRPASRAARHVGLVVFGPAAPHIAEAVDAAAVPRARPVAPPRAARPHAVRHHIKLRPRPARAARAAPRSRPHATRAARHRPELARMAGGAGAVVSYAYDQLGRPYVRGGTGDGGFDCSGLTMRAFARAGIRLPHKAARQAGRPVSLSHARPGDLVKWGSEHVGVYVGGGYVIHAPKPGDHVKKAHLWGSYQIVRVL
jgi:cell wall-associated NlpC family hydrolase